MRITLIIGADGAPFAHDLASALDAGDELTVVVPTVRGHVSAGLQASPDLDVLLTPAGTAQTFAVSSALEALGYLPRWQRVDDGAVANRLLRTDLVANGNSLTDSTLAASARASLPFRLLPVCDDRTEFRVVVGTEDAPRAVHVDEYLNDPSAHTPTQLLLVAERASVSPTVSQTVLDTDVLVLGPSSRTLAIDPVLRTPGFAGLVADDLVVLVTEHTDTAPEDLVRVAGLRHDVPGDARPVPADVTAVVAAAREAVA